MVTKRRHRIPKKPKDGFKKRYTPREFGFVLLSNTKQITENDELQKSLAANCSVQDLLEPLFAEFFQAQGDKWQVSEPMQIAAQNEKTEKWKSCSALGGEILRFKEINIGSRDGVCIRWDADGIIGMDENMVVDTTLKAMGDKIVPAQLAGNPANRATLIDILLDHAGKADIVTAAQEAKDRLEAAIKLKIVEDLERKTEAYGEGFGQWA